MSKESIKRWKMDEFKKRGVGTPNPLIKLSDAERDAKKHWNKKEASGGNMYSK